MHGTAQTGQNGRAGGSARAAATFEAIVEGIPVSGNNERRAARVWKQMVAEAAAPFVGTWRFRERGELSALMVLFHTGSKHCDTDNIPKHVLDALQGLVYANDRQISQVVVRQTRQHAGFVVTDPPPLVAARLGEISDFLYVRIADGPVHGIMPPEGVLVSS